MVVFVAANKAWDFVLFFANENLYDILLLRDKEKIE